MQFTGTYNCGAVKLVFLAMSAVKLVFLAIML